METLIKLKIIQHNVNSWKTNKINLINIYNQENPDVILINGHGINEDENLKIYNYIVYHSNKRNERFNGTAIAVKQSINHRINDNYHSDLLSVQIITNLGTVEIATNYIPPRVGYLNYADFHKLLSQNHPVYFLGDLNARNRFLGHNNTNRVGQQLETLVNNGHAIHDGPHFPTFITARTKTSPDIIMKNSQAHFNTFAEPGPLTSSDHIPIIYKISTSPILTNITPRLNYRRADWSKYRNLLSEHPNIDLSNATPNDIDNAATNWTSQIQKASTESIPTTTVRTIPHIKPTPYLKNLQTQHQQIIDEIQMFGPSYNRQQNLLNLRREIKTKYQELYTEKWNELVNNTDHERNSKDFWHSIKRMIGKTSSREINYLRGHNGEDIYEDDEKEEIFRNYWQKVFKISDEENIEFDQNHEVAVMENLTVNAESLEPLNHTNYELLKTETDLVYVKEVKDLIKSLKQRSPGEDNITKYHMSELPDNSLKNYTKILNASLATGYFPKIWKVALMIFIPKPSKSPLHHTNYRPISLLSVPGKLFEKIINNRFISHLDHNNLHNPRQHGFRKNRGTHTATALLYEIIATAIANKNKVNIVLRDISKAFDKVWHNGLRYKLKNSPIPNYLIRIISNYLQDRTAKIRIGNYIGPEFPLLSGVPQGGCLSPTLFNFYTKDTPTPSGNNEQIIYADDITQIIQTQNNEKYLALQTTREIENVNNFENQWKIKTNQNKFQIIPINRNGKEKVKTGTLTHDYQKTGKALGTIISTRGFSPHITSRIQAAKAKLSTLYRFINLSSNNKRKIYQSLVKSVLEYPPIPLHPISITQQKKMQTIQNKASRIITNIRKLDRKTSKYVNEQARLIPINISIHNQAIRIWQTVRDAIPIDILNKLELHPNRNYSNRFPSSLAKLNAVIEPTY